MPGILFFTSMSLCLLCLAWVVLLFGVCFQLAYFFWKEFIFCVIFLAWYLECLIFWVFKQFPNLPDFLWLCYFFGCWNFTVILGPGYDYYLVTAVFVVSGLPSTTYLGLSLSSVLVGFLIIHCFFLRYFVFAMIFFLIMALLVSLWFSWIFVTVFDIFCLSEFSFLVDPPVC